MAPSTQTDHDVPAMAPPPAAACDSAAQVAPEPSETARPTTPSTDTPAAWASSRIAGCKRTAAELAEIRRRTKRLFVKKEAAAVAAAFATALPLGCRASSNDSAVPAVRLQSASPTQDPTGPSTSGPFNSASASTQAASVVPPRASTLAELLAAPATSTACTHTASQQQ
ncbi:hypothetical protein PR003_g10875 [Phytophthora rubi]|uniref:Uncharacterized protein n=1 Tax=Phytophthora rubi TaxID=129364 RepID=A0A6A4FCA9_9STRA|nr:hypothetical protein PR002_g8926 [Phytophthora rubi]KAE9037059.1 hypothetical protein PR001_g8541 [Phytophthora rubi]KAE9339715.1 hypothetical protein PR003_g10875 [Phytophthora rubi]